MKHSTIISKSHKDIGKSLFPESSFYPDSLPNIDKLLPANNLSSVFEDCHNYIYANEGLLKDKIFHEMVKLLVVKLYDENNNFNKNLKFGITSEEYKKILENKSNNFLIRFNELYTEVRAKYESLIREESIKLQPLTLAYVVGCLQNISLTKTPGDIKGEAFQAFVSRHQRGDRGEFFTPYPVVKLAVEMLAPNPYEKIIDPACGSGGFLIESIGYIARNYNEAKRSDYIKNYIQGIEFNPDVALSAAIRLAFEGGKGSEIICTNSLYEQEELNGQFDIILTNPPFGSKGKIDDQRILKHYVLANRWSKISDNDWKISRNILSGQSPEILFIEKSLKLLRPGGRMAIVLPDGILQNITNSHVRFWILSQAKVIGVASIPQEAFIPYGTGIKTSLLILQKLPSQKYKACFMAIIKKMGYDVKGQTIYKRDKNGNVLKNKSGIALIDDDIGEISSDYIKYKKGTLSNKESIFVVPEEIMNSRFDVEHYQPRDQKIIEHLKSSGAKPLGEIVHLLNEADDFRLETDKDIRYIAISDVDSRTMQVVSQQIIISHEAPSRAKYRVIKGDIITATSGASTGTNRHATALITKDEDGAICSNGFAVLRNVQHVNPFFLLSYMRTEYFLRQVRRLMTGHAIPSISIEDLSKVLIPIPPKEDQDRIAKSVSSILCLRKEALKSGELTINETERLIENL